MFDSFICKPRLQAIFESNAATFNAAYSFQRQFSTDLWSEEKGEIALSSLARSVINDGSCSKVDKLNNNFELIHLFRETAKEMNSDFGISSKFTNKK